MGSYVLVWDLETVPDLPCVARVNGLAEGDDDGARAALGDKFPSCHSTRSRALARWWPSGSMAFGTSAHSAHRISESAVSPSCCSPFVDRIETFKPQMVTFNGSSFDLYERQNGPAEAASEDHA